jgi:hypothetical protein
MKLQKPLADASLEELRAFAQNYLGIKIHPFMKVENARAKVREATSKDSITVEVPDEIMPIAGSAAGDAIIPFAAGDDEMVRVEIFPTEAPGGDEPVPLGVNGAVIWVKRGQPERIPRRHFEVLKHSVETRYYMQTDDEGLPVMVPREVSAYKYQVLPG